MTLNTPGFPSATWVSDYAYIMWKDVEQVTTNKTDDFARVIQGNFYGFDSNAYITTLLTLISSISQIAVIVFSWVPFGEWFRHQVEVADLANLPD